MMAISTYSRNTWALSRECLVRQANGNLQGMGHLILLHWPEAFTGNCCGSQRVSYYKRVIVSARTILYDERNFAPKNAPHSFKKKKFFKSVHKWASNTKIQGISGQNTLRFLFNSHPGPSSKAFFNSTIGSQAWRCYAVTNHVIKK